MPSWPLTLTGEILVDGTWQPVSMRETSEITVSRGASSEGSTAQPSYASVTLDNRRGIYSPRNPRSPLYGKIGRNTPFRLRVGDLPADPTPHLSDAFARTETDGWGTADTGQEWEIYDPFSVSPPASDYSVADGTGRILLTSVDEARYIRAAGTDLSDLDATFTIMTEERAQGTHADGAVLASFIARLDPVDHTFYMFHIGYRVDTGLPDGQGLRVSVNIVRFDGPVGVSLALQKSVPGLVYEPGVPLRVRVQAIGADLRVRVWADGQAEPPAWHSQAYDETYTSGEIGLRARVDTAPTTEVPFFVHFGDLRVAEPTPDTGVIRIRGEIPAWPPQRHTSGLDLVVPIEPAGIMRRLDTGTKPLKSVMRRHIPPLFPLAYWPMEEGERGGTQVADASGNTGPLRVQRFEFAQADGLPGSAPLPQLTKDPIGTSAGASMSSPPIPSVATGSWSVHMMFRISEEDFPGDIGTTGAKTILAFRVAESEAAYWIVALYTSGGSRFMRLTIRDSDGVQLASATASHEASLAGGGPSLINEWRRLRITAVQNGSGTDYQFLWLAPDGSGWGNVGTLANTSTGRVSRIDTYFGSEATDGEIGGLALGHLSVWGVTESSAYQQGSLASTEGLRGQTARAFLDRLASQEGLPLEITGPGEMVMGPYPEGTVMDIVRQVEATEMGMLTERRDGLALAYRTHETLYNQTPDLVLDYSNGEIFDPFEPIDDDKDVRNKITVRRVEGSEATAILETGPLSIQPPPDGVGEYETSVDTIVDDDDQLGDQASWRLHLGTVDQMRVAKLHLTMGNPRMQPLIDQVLQLDVGSRIRIINLPDDLPPEGFDLLVTGYSETFATGRWDITFSCVPASPWDVAHVEDDVFGHADTDGSELAAPAGEDDTTIYVRAYEGPEWTTDPTDLPVDLRVGGEIVRVTAIAAALGDTPMAGDGAASEASDTSHVAPAVTAPGTTDLLICAWCTWSDPDPYTLPVGMTQQDQTSGDWSTLADATEQLASSGSTGTRTATHAADAWAAVSIVASGTPTIEEHLSDLGNAEAVTLTTAADTEAGWWLLAVHGWDQDVNDEMLTGWGDEWELVADSDSAGDAAARITAWTKRITKAGPQAVAYATGTGVTDNHARLYVLSGVVDLRAQAMTVIRSINGVHKSHSAGSDIRLAYPAIVAL